jgi:hypothetical protein
MQRAPHDLVGAGDAIHPEPETETNVLGHGQPWEQTRVLECDSDGLDAESTAELQDTGVQSIKPGERPQERRLAAAARTEQDQYLATMNDKVEVLEDDVPARAPMVGTGPTR